MHHVFFLKNASFLEKTQKKTLIFIEKSSFYQAVQFIYDETNDRWVYYHGHRAGTIETFNQTINLGSEKIVTEPYNNARFF